MANYIYGAVALIGGGTGSLDSIDGTDLAENDAAIVFTDSATYIYTLDESSGGTESSPELITPDTNEGNKRWVLVSSRASESSLNVSAFAGILDANDDDVQKAMNTIDDMFNTDDFTIAAGGVEIVPTVVKSVTTDSGTVTVNDHVLDIIGTGKVNTVGSNNKVTISVDDLAITTKTSNYTITAADDIVIGDCSGGNVELTLPQSSLKSEISIFKKSTANNLTINCYGSETIEGQASFDLTDEYGYVKLISDGVNTWVRSAEMYDLVTASDSVLGGVKIGDNLEITNGVLGVDFTAINEDIVPDVDVTRSLGSASKQWKDIYVGPGSLYVNGQEVVSDNSGTIVISADEDQNIQVKSLGTGDIELVPAGTGVVQIKGGVSILAGKNITSSDGNPISFTNGINLNNNALTGLPTPSAGTDAVTLTYVNTYASNASNITTGTLPSGVLPPIAMTTVQTAISEAAMLALTVQEGDVVVRTDESRSYIHNGLTSNTMADFNELQTPTDAVLSVNGETGTVVLNQDEVGDGSIYVRTQNDFNDTLLGKLNGIEASADVNNISDVNATDLTDAGDSSLHYHSADRARSAHTGTQTASTISDFDTEVANNSAVTANTNKETNVTTNISIDHNASNVDINSSDGTNGTINEASGSTAGVMTPAMHDKLDGIETNATADQSAAEILTLIKTVDGAASGLDADLLDGQSGSYYQDWNNTTNKPSTYVPTIENVQDIVGGMVTGNTETGISVVYQDDDGTLDFSLTNDPVITLNGDVTGSGTMTNLSSVSITAAVVNDSHTHTGSTISALDGADITTGTISDARLPATITSSITGSSASCTGNAATATTATNASKVYCYNDDTGDTNCPIMFTANSTEGYKALYEDSSLYFDNTNNILHCPTFSGVSTTARYADLAEKHTCQDETLITGTVVSACQSSEYEVEECSIDKASNVIGVISEKAGYILNNDLTDSVIVGLTGKVPVRLIGQIEKGQPIVSAGNGCARQAIGELELLYKMGVALESNYGTEEKLVYCAIK